MLWNDKDKQNRPKCQIFHSFCKVYQKLRIIAFHETCNIKHETNIRHEEKDFFKRYNLPAISSVSLALKTLLNKEFVYKSHNGYIYDRFFGMWLRKNNLF